MYLRRTGFVVAMLCGISGIVARASAADCNTAGGLRFCVIEASVRTHKTLRDGSQEIIATVQFKVTNETDADVSFSLAERSAAVIVGGVTMTDLANRSGLVGIRQGERPGDFVTIAPKQSQTIAFNFDDWFNLNAIGPIARDDKGRFSAIVHVADAGGKRNASVSVSDFRLRNEVRPGG